MAGKHLCSLLICIVACTATAHVQARNTYPFGADAPLARANQMTHWAATLERHALQRSALYDCSDDCRGRLRSFQRMMDRADGLSMDEKIKLAHLYINRSKHKDDRAVRVYDDSGSPVGRLRSQWATLFEFLHGGGDCEDFATAKYFMLRELGLRAENLRVVVTYERKLRGYHAVVAVRRDDGQVWLLDSDNLIRKHNHGGYRYVFAVNEDYVWDHESRQS